MQQREEALALETDSAAWKRYYRRAIEYPASQIFVALKGGHLHGSGRLLPPTMSRRRASWELTAKSST